MTVESPLPAAEAALRVLRPDRLAAALTGLADGVVVYDPDWTAVWANPAAAALLGRPVTALLGRRLSELFPAAADPAVHAHYARCRAEQRAVTFETRHDPQRAWLEVHLVPAADSVVAAYRDVTARRRNDVLLTGNLDALTRLAEDAPLAAVLDAVTAMVEQHAEHGARASVLLVEDGRLRHGSAPSLPPSYNAAIDGLPIGPTTGSCGTAAYRREQVVVADIATDPLWADYRELALGAGLRACWSTPVLGPDGRVLATFATYYPEPRRPGAVDQQVIEQVTRTVAIAVQHERSRRALRAAVAAAETLQRSLLTEPPQPPGLAVAARYHPAVSAAEVGGDWYDAFALPDGRLGLVIGDVVGHDLMAAATMGQLRSMLRALACDSNDDPAGVLNHLDRLAEQLRITEFTSVVFAAVEGLPGGPVRLRWSNAGHPPPLLFTRDGASRPLDHPVDPPIGVWAGNPRQDTVVDLPAGATLLLYTDGLVEVRGVSLDERTAALCAHAARYASAPLEEFCDAVLAFTGQPADDVALLAVRVDPSTAGR